MRGLKQPEESGTGHTEISNHNEGLEGISATNDGGVEESHAILLSLDILRTRIELRMKNQEIPN
jgi:hypothetical protein